MIIRYPDRFKEATPANFDGLFEWDYLLPIFHPTKIQPMDIDSVVERNGCFLFHETKKPGKDIPFGQSLMFERLLEKSQWDGDMWLMIIWGKDKDSIVSMQEWYVKDKQLIKTPIVKCDWRHHYSRVLSWWKWANSLKKPASGINSGSYGK